MVKSIWIRYHEQAAEDEGGNDDRELKCDHPSLANRGGVYLHGAQSWRSSSRAQALSPLLQQASYTGPTACVVATLASLRVPRPTGIFGIGLPQMGGGSRSKGGTAPLGPLDERGNAMKVVRRIAIALGSLLAVAMAGGAHWRG